MRDLSLEDTIVAISTPLGEGGIGIVRLSGRQALSIADKIFASKDGKKPSEFETYTTHYGWIVDSYKKPRINPTFNLEGFLGGTREINVKKANQQKCEVTTQGKYTFLCPKKPETSNQKTLNGQTSRRFNDRTEYIDEVILTVMRAPASYTREDIVEINCHSGIVPLRQVLELVLRLGGRMAQPGEFTKRAFLNGRIDLAQAEAVLDVVRSKTELSLRLALDQLQGRLSDKIKLLRDAFLEILAHIEASIDFPEEDIEISSQKVLLDKMKGIAQELKSLLDTASWGMALREGVMIVICGRPNVGKSSLMNALLRKERVIVTPIPGTTRDIIEEVVNIKGIPLRMVDTAGLIEPKDLITREGVARTNQYLGRADLVLLVLDWSQAIQKQDFLIMDRVKDKRTIIVINKVDLPQKINLEGLKELLDGKKKVKVSATKGTGLASLEEQISQMFWQGQLQTYPQGLINRARHKEAIRKCYKSTRDAIRAIRKGLSPELVALDVKGALEALGEITGQISSEEVLGKIFCEFCIGK